MFSREKINTGRQLEIDIARGLAVLFMIFIHAQLFFANEAVVDSTFGAFNDFVGMVPSAPMFMFLLGVGINYTRKNDSKLFFKRGGMLILSGYLLNFLKGFLPNVINAYRTMDIAYLYEGIAELMYIDILHFSGLAMIMFGLFKLWRLKPRNILLTGFGLAALNIFLLQIKTDNFWLASITGLIWGTSDYSYFPFLTWAFYPIAGFVFGSYLIRCTNKKKFYMIASFVSAIIFIGGTYLFNYYLGITNGMANDHGYYHHILTDNITFTALVIFEISLLAFLAPMLPKFLEKIVARWSKNVTPIFFIHWIIITWSALIITSGSLNMLQFIVLLIVIIPVSDIIANEYSKIKSKKKINLEEKKSIKIIKSIAVIGLTVSICIFCISAIANSKSENIEQEISAVKYVENEDMKEFVYSGVVDSESGEPNGEGTAYYSNGDVYIGDFKEGLRHGTGSFVSVNGEKYYGSFEEDDYNGYGEYTDSDGSLYKGEFRNGEFHGKGRLTNTDGSVESGIWNDGVLETNISNE